MEDGSAAVQVLCGEAVGLVIDGDPGRDWRRRRPLGQVATGFCGGSPRQSPALSFLGFASLLTSGFWLFLLGIGIVPVTVAAWKAAHKRLIVFLGDFCLFFLAPIYEKV